MPTRPRDTLPLAILLVAAVASSLAASGDGTLPGDVRLTRWLQANPIPFADPLTMFTNDYGSGHHLTVAGAAVAVGLAAARRVDAALLIALATALRSTNSLLKTTFDSPRPTPDLVRVTEQASGLGFPSGHAMGSALLLGALAYAVVRLLAPNRGEDRQPPGSSPLPGGEGPGVRASAAAPPSSPVRRPARAAAPLLRRAAVAACLGLILLTGYGRVFVGAHWPTDVLGGWLWGAILATVAVHLVRLATRRRTEGVSVPA